ncbi:MAG: ribonuclease R [Patescibacteria group bacterium]|nr:ribonuclease R [Patescibacteria group bacterium]
MHLSYTYHNNTIMKKMRGIISTTGKGVGYINDEKKSLPEDIEIQTGFLNTALNGDEVEILLHPIIKGQRQSGEVVSVVKRAKDTFVGVLECSKNLCFLIPDDRKMYVDIFVLKENNNQIKTGTKAQVKIVKWDKSQKNPQGEIIKILGEKGTHNVEMESIVLEKGFDLKFPIEVEKEAEKIRQNKKITTEEIAKRKDFRNTLTFTIDPFDAKDFDDAISFKKLEENRFEIGVHIADVSHYVIPNTALDKEALSRGCSIYLVDRTIPMLPEVLSNDVCSLNPNEDKLTFSAVFVMDTEGIVHESWFGKTIINSDKRFTYENAQETIDAGLSTQAGGQYAEELRILNKIAKKLQQEKFRAGAIEFEQDEIKFKLDENFKPIGVYKKARLDTHKLVEEYMLLANREVAKYIYNSIKKKGGKGISSIYRIHNTPDKEKIENLAILVKALGYELPIKEKGVSQQDINALLKRIEGKAEEGLIKTAAIRSMAKAIYSIDNVGHFGLAFEYYTHFTSPIRRYPDLLVQRILEAHLTGAKLGDKDFVQYSHIASKSTEREISASEAERASKKYKQVEYMKEKIGQEFNGIISGVTEWGIYVEEEETRSEGMIKLRDMNDDFYELDKKKYAIIGTKTGKMYQLGGKIRFKVKSADLNKKTLDYVLA